MNLNIPKLKGIALLLFLCLGFTPMSKGQLISSFSFADISTVLVATSGPNATSVNALAIVSGNRVKMPSTSSGAGVGINLVVPGSPHFDVDHMDITVNFEGSSGEGTGYFFGRGFTKFGWRSNKLVLDYRTTDGAGGFTNYTLTTNYTLDNSNPHDYSFSYDDVLGVATILVDGVAIASSDGPDGRPLYWAGAGDAIIGFEIDNNNNDSNSKGLGFITINGGNTPMPIFYLSVKAVSSVEFITVQWEVIEIKEVGYYFVERSIDGIHFNIVQEGIPMQKGNTTNTYQIKDYEVNGEKVYYRIGFQRVIGEIAYSAIINSSYSSKEVKVFYNGESIEVQNPFNVDIKVLNLIKVDAGIVSENLNLVDELGVLKIIALSKGVYVLSLSIDSELRTEKILVY